MRLPDASHTNAVRTETHLNGSFLSGAPLKRAPGRMRNFVRCKKIQPTNEVVGFWLVSISIGKLVIRRDYPVRQHGESNNLIKQESAPGKLSIIKVFWFSVGVLQYGRTSRLSSGPEDHVRVRFLRRLCDCLPVPGILLAATHQYLCVLGKAPVGAECLPRLSTDKCVLGLPMLFHVPCSTLLAHPEGLHGASRAGSITNAPLPFRIYSTP